MKNERLMDVLGTVSPAYVAEAAPGNVPAKRKRPVRPVRMLIAAAIIIATLMASILGMTISAEDKGPQLQEVPVIILREDFDRLIAQKMDEIDAQESTPRTVKMNHMRFKAFYEQQFMLETLSPNHKKAMLERFPITELRDVYNLDLTASDVDKAFLLDELRAIGFTQEDLIECYQHLYELAEQSNSENKEEILASLPDIPELPDQDE